MAFIYALYIILNAILLSTMGKVVDDDFAGAGNVTASLRQVGGIQFRLLWHYPVGDTHTTWCTLFQSTLSRLKRRKKWRIAAAPFTEGRATGGEDERGPEDLSEEPSRPTRRSSRATLSH